MLNLVSEEVRNIEEIKQKYVISLEMAKELYVADEIRELVVAICGKTYVDAECAETRWHMRTKTAKKIGLTLITLMESEQGFPEDDSFEPIIIYDERIGKIPYSYTDPVVDYDIHGEPELMRIECDESFLYSMIKLGVVRCFERGTDGKFASFTKLYDVEKLLDEAVEPFRHIDERVPLHKKLGE